MRVNDAVFGIVFMIAGAAIAVEAQSFPPVPGQQYGSAFFPRLIGPDHQWYQRDAGGKRCHQDGA